MIFRSVANDKQSSENISISQSIPQSENEQSKKSKIPQNYQLVKVGKEQSLISYDSKSNIKP